MNRKSTLFFVFILLCLGVVQAQDDVLSGAGETNPCFSVEELEQMLHMPFREAYDMLDAKGYQMGFFFDKSSGEYHDTIDGIVLTYSRMAFNNINDRKSAFWLYTSQDGLSNIVEWERNMPGACTLFPLFHQKGYIYDRSNSLFRGSGLYNGTVEQYEVQYYDDTLVMHVTMKNILEIEKLVSERRKILETNLLLRVDEARIMAQGDQYLHALALLDSLRGNGDVVDSAINSVSRYVVEQAEIFYFAKLNELVNVNGDLKAGVNCCDTLLLFTQSQDSVREIRAILQDQLDGSVNRYSELRPQEYGKLVKELEKMINDELSMGMMLEEQRMKMTFTILTRKENESSGTINIGMTSKGEKNFANAPGVRSRMLQQRVNELARSEWIQPVRSHGVFLPTRDQITADIRWHYYVQQVIDECNATNKQLSSAVKYIDDRYFATFDTIRSSLSQQSDEMTVKGRVHKPTKRIYTFTINEKRMGDTYYTDIYLTKFSTTGLLSWTPSIIIPGLGTKNQGLHSTVGTRAIPFFLCTALAIAGFVWENNGGKNVERPTFEDGGAVKPWYYKDIGYYVGYGAGAIAATIYITELVESISCSFRNLHRSKELRKNLKMGPITVQTENVRLQ